MSDRFIKGWYGIFLVPLIFLFVFFFYPLFSILDISLRPQGEWDWSGFSRLITSNYYLETLLFTIWQAFLSTVITILFALPGAYIFSQFQFWGKPVLLSLITMPFVLPTVVVASAMNALLGERGLLNTVLMTVFGSSEPLLQVERTLTIIIIAHLFYNYSVALQIISTFWANQSPRIAEAARVLGANRWGLWWYVILPLLRPAILTASILIFVFTFTSFGVVLILGGVRFATLEVQIYYQALNVFNLPLAAALSLVQIIFMGIFLLVYTHLQQSNYSQELANTDSVAKIPTMGVQKWLIYGNLVVIVILILAPLLALVVRSLTFEQGFSFHYFQILGTNQRNSLLAVSPISALTNSLSIAIVTVFLSTVLGVLTAYLVSGRIQSLRTARWLDSIFMLPLATSAVTLGFGFIIALDTPPLDLRSSWWMTPIAHTLVATPFVVRAVLPALRRIPANLIEASSVLGADSIQQRLQIEFPLISRSLAVGAVFAFTISMGEFGASLFTARPDMPTIPIAIFRLLGQPGQDNYGQALALSVLLMLVCAVAYLVIQQLRDFSAGEF